MRRGVISLLGLIFALVLANNDDICSSDPTESQCSQPSEIPNGYHVLVFENDKRYEGNILNGKYHGYGVYVTLEGTYEGQ